MKNKTITSSMDINHNDTMGSASLLGNFWCSLPSYCQCKVYVIFDILQNHGKYVHVEYWLKQHILSGLGFCYHTWWECWWGNSESHHELYRIQTRKWAPIKRQIQYERQQTAPSTSQTCHNKSRAHKIIWNSTRKGGRSFFRCRWYIY